MVEFTAPMTTDSATSGDATPRSVPTAIDTPASLATIRNTTGPNVQVAHAAHHVAPRRP